MKVILVGPCKSGKSGITDLLLAGKGQQSGSPPFEYEPTEGCRIIESLFADNGDSIEIWDCSGDIKFRSCWPAIKEGVNAVILVYDPVIHGTDDHMLLWRDEFCSLVHEENLLILAHSQSGNPTETFENSRAPAPSCLGDFIIHYTSFSYHTENFRILLTDFFQSLKK